MTAFFRKLLAITSLSLAMIQLLAPSTVLGASDFCWRDSKPRGVGTIPTGCEPGKTEQDGLCYSPCPNGMRGVGPVCWSSCPSGYRDMGAVCHIDKPLTTGGSWTCSSKDLFGDCYAWGWHHHCPSGYTNAGAFCALDTPSTPPGFSGTGLDPMKNSQGRGAGTIPENCGPNKDNQAGLCYNKCPAGYAGAGPVCWGQAPTPPQVKKAWVECGMGAAASKSSCASATFSQVSSVGMAVVNIALLVTTAGAGSEALDAAEDAAKGANEATKVGEDAAKGGEEADQEASKVKQLVQWFKNRKGDLDAMQEKFKTEHPDAYKKMLDANKARKVAQKGYKAATVVDELTTAQSPEDITRAALQAASMVDPTGLTGVAAAYDYAKCSDMPAEK